MSEAARSHTVVIAAASRHGSTTDIAARIAGTLRERLSPTWAVELVDLAHPHDFSHADAVVLGSAVYLGHWLKPAIKALHRVKDAALIDLWLFSSGPVSVDPDENARVIAADEMVESGCATEHMVFAGCLDVSQLFWWERLAARAVGSPSIERREWDEIDQWATSIATQLTAAVASSEPRK